MTWTIATALQVIMAEDSDARVQALRNLSVAQLEALHSDLNDAHRAPAPGPAPSNAEPAPAPSPAPAQHRGDEDDADYQWHSASHRPARGGGYQTPPGQHRSGLHRWHYDDFDRARQGTDRLWSDMEDDHDDAWHRAEADVQGYRAQRFAEVHRGGQAPHRPRGAAWTNARPACRQRLPPSSSSPRGAAPCTVTATAANPPWQSTARHRMA